ncbi:hypothetical protein MMC21_000270 [Puttea exsequens]|nr:hypothetical protein [Puttea exsequens]
MGKIQELIKDWSPQTPGSAIVRQHSPYCESTGPIVKEGFVAARVQALHSTSSESTIPFRSHSPMTPCPRPGVRQWEVCTPPRRRSTQTPATIACFRGRGHTVDCPRENEPSTLEQKNKDNRTPPLKASTDPPPPRFWGVATPQSFHELSSSPTPPMRTFEIDDVFGDDSKMSSTKESSKQNLSSSPSSPTRTIESKNGFGDDNRISSTKQSSIQDHTIVSPRALPSQMTNPASSSKPLPQIESQGGGAGVNQDLRARTSIADKLGSMVERGWVGLDVFGKAQEDRRASEPLPPSSRLSNERRTRRSRSDGHESHEFLPPLYEKEDTRVSLTQRIPKQEDKEREAAASTARGYLQPWNSSEVKSSGEGVSTSVDSGLGIPRRWSMNRYRHLKSSRGEGTELNVLAAKDGEKTSEIQDDTMRPASNCMPSAEPSHSAQQSRHLSLSSTRSVRSVSRRASSWFKMYRPRLVSIEKRSISRMPSRTSSVPPNESQKGLHSPDGAQEAHPPFIEAFPPLFEPSDKPATWWERPPEQCQSPSSPDKRYSSGSKSSDKPSTIVRPATQPTQMASSHRTSVTTASLPDMRLLSGSKSSDKPSTMVRPKTQSVTAVSGSKTVATAASTSSIRTSYGDSSSLPKTLHSIRATRGSSMLSSLSLERPVAERMTEPQSSQMVGSPRGHLTASARTSAANIDANFHVHSGPETVHRETRVSGRGIKRVQVTISFDGASDLMIDARLDDEAGAEDSDLIEEAM